MTSAPPGGPGERDRLHHIGRREGWSAIVLFDDEATGHGNGRAPRNVLGGPLALCAARPLTGFYRTGRCATGREDAGCHTVCAVVTAAFLRFSRERGNDLSTPQPAWDFPGLRPGDRWCLCAPRWREAWDAGAAPLVVLEATEAGALDHCSLDALRAHAAVD